MQRITVTKVESKPTKTGGTYTKITDDKGGTFSGFDEALARLQPGAILDAEIEVSGKYANLKSYSVVGQPNLTPAQPSPQAPTRQIEPVTTRSITTNDSIEFQVCLKEVGECLRWNEKAVPYAARAGYWKAICERLGTSDLFEDKPESKEESHLVAEAQAMGGTLQPTQQTMTPGKPATRSQIDAIKSLSGKEAPTGITIDGAKKLIAELQAGKAT